MRAWLCYIGLLMVSVLPAQETQRYYLSGTGSDHTVQWDFYCTAGMHAGTWSKIAVPSCWELQGFGKYDYGFSKDSARGKEEGLYKYHFQVPQGWKGKVTELVFEGVMTDATVKVNGKPAGAKHEGAFYVFRYDVSALLKYNADNLLEVTVAKHSANASVNAAERKGDFWLFGGIFRPVYLNILPVQHISDLAVDASASGVFTAAVQVAGKADKLSVQLYDGNGVAVGGEVSAPVTNGVQVLLKHQYQQPLLWNCETPHLYNAVFTLYDQGKVVHTIQQRVGFRTVEVKQRDGVYVNGVKVKMKGVNRHSFWPSTGRTTSKQLSIEDVLLMKDMNMNAVRMSHYPPDAHFLDICDSLGLFVMDELAGWHGHYDTPTGTKLLKEMIAHDRNHPSIIFWANGNEGGHNLELDSLFTAYDALQQRPVIHPWQTFGGFETQHYRDYSYGIGQFDHGHNIVMPTEFLHGMYDGGHGAGLDDYWEAMWHNPLSAGGFLWDFADEGVLRTDKNGEIDTDGNHGPDGIVGPHHEKEGSYYAIKEIWSPVHMVPREMTPAFDGRFTIENRYFFSNTNTCRFSWKLAVPGSNRVISGTAAAPDITPGAQGILQVPLPAEWTSYDVLYLTAVDAAGQELFTWSFPIALPERVAARTIQKQGTAGIQVSETDSAYTITANGVQVQFHKRTGLLTGVRNGKGALLLQNGPVIQQGVTNFAGFTLQQHKDSVVIASKFDTHNSYNTLEWTVYASGWIRMKLRYFPGAYNTDYIGVNFSFPEKEMLGIDYMGKGPYRVWKNRLKGGRLDVFHKDYNNTETGEAPFVYPEFKGYYANLYRCRFIGREQPFTVVAASEDVFLRLFTPVVKDDPKDTWKNLQYVFPDGDISFMQGISGVGTKTQKRETTGPQGMKNIMYDYEKEPSRALEMILYFDFREETAH